MQKASGRTAMVTVRRFAGRCAPSGDARTGIEELLPVSDARCRRVEPISRAGTSAARRA